MYTSRKVYLDLTSDQEVALHQTIRMTSKVFNLAIGIANEKYKEKNYELDYNRLIEMCRNGSKLMKWTYQFSDYLFNRAIIDASEAFNKFLRGKYKSLPHRAMSRPRSGFTIGKPNLIIKADEIFIEGLIRKQKNSEDNWLKFKERNAIPKHELLCNLRIVFDGFHFYLVFALNTHPRYLDVPKTEGVGIDVGLKTLATLSNGVMFENIFHTPKMQHQLRRLEQLQSAIQERRASSTIDAREVVSSISTYNMELEYRRLSRHVSNVRLNYLHKVSKMIVLANPAFIAVETLDISSMRDLKKISVSLQQTALGMFLDMLEYKAKLYNIPFIKVEHNFASSKTCCYCGHIKKDLTLNDRTYVCDNCGFKIDRDINAAVNIYKRALYSVRKQSGCKASFNQYYSASYKSWMKKIVKFID